jgi:tetratricopeptide (TPR) repeat protein
MKSRVLFVFLLLAGLAVAQPNVGSSKQIPDPHEFDVPAVRLNEMDRTYGLPGGASLSASDLAAPSRARKEIEKANQLIAKQDLTQAAERLNRAIAIYPTYAVAYNNLGVIYKRLGDHVREREALQRAISLNDHYALAYVNLGRMSMIDGDYPSAESALDKASSCDPTDPITLILLSYVEFMQGRFDQAVATSRRAHALRKPHAVAHRLAARAFEQQRQRADAIAELEMFLKEEPSGARADEARSELELVKSVLQ